MKAKFKKVKKWNAPRKAKAKRRLDRLFSELVLMRDNRTCRWCGKAKDETGKQFKMDCSHCIPREVLRLRWDDRNGITLCFACHKVKRLNSWHGSPLVAVAWLRRELGDQHCDRLLVEAHQPYDFTEEEFKRIDRRLTFMLANAGLEPGPDLL